MRQIHCDQFPTISRLSFIPVTSFSGQAGSSTSQYMPLLPYARQPALVALLLTTVGATEPLLLEQAPRTSKFTARARIAILRRSVFERMFIVSLSVMC